MSKWSTSRARRLTECAASCLLLSKRSGRLLPKCASRLLRLAKRASRLLRLPKRARCLLRLSKCTCGLLRLSKCTCGLLRLSKCTCGLLAKRARTSLRLPKGATAYRLLLAECARCGGLLLAMTLKLKALGLPLPAALAPSTPWADLAGESDSYRTNAGVDGVLPFYDGVLGGAARLYAGPAGLHDPLVSPVHGDFAGFPPSLLTTGTRDILLSDTVRVYRAMRKAAVEARIEIYEAMSHAEYTAAPDSPESASVFGDIAAWFDRWLAR